MIEGSVTSGEGKAAKFLDKKPYREFIDQKVGFKPYPGTLNLQVDPEEFREFRKGKEKYSMNSREFKGVRLGAIELYPVKIEDEEASVIEPDRSRYDDSICEVVASQNLREKHGLEDGDRVKLKSI